MREGPGRVPRRGIPARGERREEERRIGVCACGGRRKGAVRLVWCMPLLLVVCLLLVLVLQVQMLRLLVVLLVMRLMLLLVMLRLMLLLLLLL